MQNIIHGTLGYDQHKQAQIRVGGPQGVCASMSPRKISKISPSSNFSSDFPLKEIPNCSPESTLIPTSLEKFDHVLIFPIIKIASSLFAITPGGPQISFMEIKILQKDFNFVRKLKFF